MNKTLLRQKYSQAREAITAEQADDKSLAIANQCLRLPIWDKSNYHLFLSIVKKKEINTDYLMQVLAGKDKNIVLSKSDFKTGDMLHFLLTDNTVLRVNSYGIPEPQEGIQIRESQLDVVFVPLLAFDEKGNRVGYGKGFYDRFLQQCQPDVIKVGLSFFEAEPLIEDVSPLDIALDYCVTPTKIYKF
ncbi:5-formyltetrahydrofolate cyclo-ligase [Myroides fluvii]|uniref:5-formyltetrahydrofolate cyclo-ligase n=1 Tax=Myroides fluvii TaxID=2572594 RepID=UPI00131C5047|nr:5-formyltetrahydrofolate cyclo-ligase [Myroides fluvii]